MIFLAARIDFPQTSFPRRRRGWFAQLTHTLNGSKQTDNSARLTKSGRKMRGGEKLCHVIAEIYRRLTAIFLRLANNSRNERMTKCLHRKFPRHESKLRNLPNGFIPKIAAPAEHEKLNKFRKFKQPWTTLLSARSLNEWMPCSPALTADRIKLRHLRAAPTNNGNNKFMGKSSRNVFRLSLTSTFLCSGIVKPHNLGFGRDAHDN